MSWIENRDVSTIQSAIQSQTVQTAIDSNTSKITDTGFLSFLQNAPIPRLFLAQQSTQSVAGVTTTLLQWGGAAKIHDPYNMQPASANTLIQIPVDGYYTFTCQCKFSAVGNYSGRFMQWLTVTSKRLGGAAELAQGFFGDGAGESANQGNVNMTINLPFNAGDSFTVSVSHNGGAGITTAGANLTWLGGGWIAPYNQYTTGSGGN